ncbi:MAG: 50S ribosomal protein L22 [Planctomycetota bacterium]|jgi:large subunit ribosomal protein L22|nr:50S ribosomal protein L22 [Planctomycetota bacterium]MDP6359738.1 50S ribosomal protein L22 [Planctomycetota bacterium]MDP6506841.1 50S ribosomal protein L22 [Planctomycetota bacterium]MDP7130602.1 50S ribosomal protein L22 [Planctomycetota bacterium]MDP7251721.1 50S ribosomal protein L22 [Planctomycetota bacterium]
MADTYHSTHKFARISPKKVRLIVDLVRGKKLQDAMSILQNSPQRGATFVDKVLRSALANAENDDSDADEDEFFVSKAVVDRGPIIYRGRAASQGRYTRIRKRTSHIHIEISTV